jgi:hypothetical protein
MSRIIGAFGLLKVWPLLRLMAVTMAGMACHFVGHGISDQAGAMPSILITLPHFSVSCLMSLPKSAGEPGRWISAKLELSEINDGFANMKAGKTLRSVIVFDG